MVMVWVADSVEIKQFLQRIDILIIIIIIIIVIIIIITIIIIIIITKYRKHWCISGTFLLKILVSNGCGLSARTSIYHGTNKKFVNFICHIDM